MLENFKNMFRKNKQSNEEISPEEKRKKSIMELSVYIIIFVVLIVTVQKNQGNIESNYESTFEDGSTIITESTSLDGISITELLIPLKNHNYNGEILINKNNINTKFSLKSENENELVIGKHINNYDVEMFYKNKNNYYKIDATSNKSEKSKFTLYDGIDSTFLNVNNILDLLSNENNIIDKIDGMFTYTISSKTIVDFYNKLNNTKYISDNNKVVVTLNYTENLNQIDMDLTNFYNIIDKTKNEIVKYTLKFNEYGKIDLSSVRALIS